mgnify:CR=1 FL=1
MVALDSGACIPEDVAVFSLVSCGTITGVVITQVRALCTIVAGHGGTAVSVRVNADKARLAHLAIADRVVFRVCAGEAEGAVADVGNWVSTVIVVPKAGIRAVGIVESKGARDLACPGEAGR